MSKHTLLTREVALRARRSRLQTPMNISRAGGLIAEGGGV